MSLLSRVPVATQRVEKHRLEALSDGLYAIALTLLVLELKVPALAHGASEQALLDALAPLLPYAAHLLAIALLAAWRTSHFIATSELHAGELDAQVARLLRLRSWTIVGSLACALVLAFRWPGFNMLALVPNAVLWRAKAG